MGVVTPGKAVEGGVQLALPIEAPAAPALRELTAWERLVADFTKTGLWQRGAEDAGAAPSADGSPGHDGERPPMPPDPAGSKPPSLPPPRPMPPLPPKRG